MCIKCVKTPTVSMSIILMIKNSEGTKKLRHEAFRTDRRKSAKAEGKY